jgi:hypothetical protein
MLGLHLHNERNIAGARERARGLIDARHDAPHRALLPPGTTKTNLIICLLRRVEHRPHLWNPQQARERSIKRLYFGAGAGLSPPLRRGHGKSYFVERLATP